MVGRLERGKDLGVQYSRTKQPLICWYPIILNTGASTTLSENPSVTSNKDSVSLYLSLPLPVIFSKTRAMYCTYCGLSIVYTVDRCDFVEAFWDYLLNRNRLNTILKRYYDGCSRMGSRMSFLPNIYWIYLQ